jgi:hypothetical protein
VIVIVEGSTAANATIHQPLSFSKKSNGLGVGAVTVTTVVNRSGYVGAACWPGVPPLRHAVDEPG